MKEKKSICVPSKLMCAAPQTQPGISFGGRVIVVHIIENATIINDCWGFK